jgi:hippurate hydrolase
VRTLKKEVAALAKKRLHEICEAIAAAHGARVEIDYDSNYPVTVNDPAEAAFAIDVAREVAGEPNVEPATPPVMGGEDFSYMLEARPGAFVFLGNGDSAALHHPAYDFNDEAIPHGISFWVRLAEQSLRR